MHELDGILDGQDVIRAAAVGQVDDGRQGGGLAAARGARHQHKALGQLGQTLDGFREAQLVGIRDLVGDDAAHEARTGAVLEVVHPQAAAALLEAVGEVRIVMRLKAFPGRG